jgi:class 3 adenylate cyclase
MSASEPGDRPSRPRGLAALVVQSAEYAEPFMTTVGMIGLLGHPLFYLIWAHVLPQPFESLALRTLASMSWLPLLLKRWWPAPWRRFLPWYWHLAVMLNVPFFFSLFMFFNHQSQVWVLTEIAGAFLLTFFVHWLLAALMFVAGAGAAFWAYQAFGGEPELPLAPPLEVLIVYLFVLCSGGLIQNRLQRHREAEASLERRLRALSGQNATMLRERNKLLGRFLSNTIINRLRRYESTHGLEAALELVTRREKRFCAIMQADIRNFSRMFEQDTELQVAQRLAQFFAEITATGQDLAVIKPVGDCIFLYSDVEQGRKEAVLNVLALACVFVESVERVNQLLATTPTGTLNFGIAVHAGDVIYGNLASDTLIDPTVIGVNVNRTARMEELTKSPAVRERVGANAIILSEEFHWFVRQAHRHLPGLTALDLRELKVSVRDFPSIARVYAMPREAALAYCPVAHERIRSKRLARAPQLRQVDYSRHRDVEYYYEMLGSGPGITWSIYVNVTAHPEARVREILRARFGHLKATIIPGGERWLALSTQDEPGEYDETDVEAWIIDFIERLTRPDATDLRRSG